MSATFEQLLAQNRPILYDGATGTWLRKLGLPRGIAPERWVLDNAAMVFAAAEAYVNAGAQMILTCTFGGTAFRLRDAGLERHAYDINRQAAQIAKQAARDRALVVGDVGPLGYLPVTLGAISYKEAVHQFADQARALADGGVDLFHIETVNDFKELRAAIAGIRDVSTLPILVTWSFSEQGKTLTGITPAQAARETMNLGVAAIGANCGNGPWEMTNILREMHRVAPDLPLIAKPNAGIPEHRGADLIYPVDAARFALLARDWVRAGVKIIGGCCGTTPEYIAAINVELGNTTLPAHRQVTIQ
ncbi:MAG: homocysteine S-methyltransferase family protein [Anaerolineae bacterium]|nr:homocysteine S-methyltransferase family protein [Anaerolineae bacterium]